LRSLSFWTNAFVAGKTHFFKTVHLRAISYPFNIIRLNCVEVSSKFLISIILT